MSWVRGFLENSNLYLLFVDHNGIKLCSPALKSAIANSCDELLNLVSTPSKIAERFQLELADQSEVEGGVLYTFSVTNNNSWIEFTGALALLHELYLQISEVSDEDEIIRISVLFALERLPLDRLGVLMIDHEYGQMIGTWGTNEQGELNDEHDFKGPIPNDTWVEQALAASDYIAVNTISELRHDGIAVGKGWNAMAALLDGGGVLGWVAVDNLLSGQPLEPWVRELIGQFGKVLSMSVARVRQQQVLRHVNENLEALVDQRNSELKQKIELLETTQQELVEAMKLASLGGLVAGLAHEINTPVGVSYTSATYLSNLVEEVMFSAQSGQLKKSDFEAFLTSCEEATEMIVSNLSNVARLVESFKMLAAEKVDKPPESLALKALVDNFIKSLDIQFTYSGIVWQLDISEDLRAMGYTSDMLQVLECLLRNSVMHGFAGDAGQVSISAWQEGGQIMLCFADNGKGLQEAEADKIFDPFYTTLRAKGGIGLGLNVVFNLMRRQGGSVELADAEQGFAVLLSLSAQ